MWFLLTGCVDRGGEGGAPPDSEAVTDPCDGVVATGFLDGDGDGYGATPAGCGDTDTVAAGGDCDDAAPDVHPGVSELCNGLDDDCDPSTPEVVQIGSVGYPSVGLALGAAVDGDVVEICDGTWTEHGLTVTADVTVTSYSGSRDAVALDGEGLGSVFRVDGGALTLRAVTVQHGLGDLSGRVSTGGGVNALYGAGGPVTVDDCRFVENVASPQSDGMGGAIAGSAIVVTDSDFDTNDAVVGGAVYVDLGGSLTVSGSTFAANSAEKGGALGAPADGAAMVVDGSVFDGNVAKTFGGAISRGDPWSPTTATDPLTLTDCTFTANEGWRGGGAIFDLEYGPMTITGSTFEANVASPPNAGSPYLAGYGGAIEAFSPISIAHSTFVDNGTGVEWCGGAISTEAGEDLDLVDTTFEGNSAHHGGAVCSVMGRVTADATTVFTGNQAIDKEGSLGLGGAVDAQQVVGGSYTGNHADGFGGAISANCSWGPCAISGVVVQGNDATLNGGGIDLDLADIADSSITDNTAGDGGGGLYVWNSEPETATLTRVTVDGNQAAWGGGLALEAGSGATLVESTITSNLAGNPGGGVYLSRASTLSVSGTDLGSDATENGPDDVFQETGGRSYPYGSGASFVCTDDAGCSP